MAAFHQIDTLEKRFPRWRTVLGCLAIVCLGVHLAGRFHVPIHQSVTVQLASAKAKAQHLDNDAHRWLPPVARIPLAAPSAPIRKVVVVGKALSGVCLDDCLYNRPPPLS